MKGLPNPFGEKLREAWKTPRKDLALILEVKGKHHYWYPNAEGAMTPGDALAWFGRAAREERHIPTGDPRNWRSLNDIVWVPAYRVDTIRIAGGHR